MRVGLVLEGGAMRGLFSAGVIDVMMENNIDVDTIIGTSAGAVFGVNYFSKQIGRTINYNKRFCKDKRYISIRNLIFTGDIVGRKFAYYKMPEVYDIFDNETYLSEIKKGKKFYATATNVKTGEAEYFEIKDATKDIECLRASASIPLASRFVKINGNKYLDGGVADPIPIEKMLELGVDKIILVLTQPLDFVKKSVSGKKFKLAKIRYGKYKNFIKKMEERHINYNNTIELIKKLEEEGKIFVIRPDSKLDINVIERDPNEMQRVYDQGISEGNKQIKKLTKFIKAR